ncbi:large ribosomal subunit protein uL3m-like isoform X1 [Primulina tabacum]|uniref:large ribosomal subunit protein uL3m-like isoform X1 n=1 Tax=Primulina tabacum TaxID=48773 RepID=UPI003F596865
MITSSPRSKPPKEKAFVQFSGLWWLMRYSIMALNFRGIAWMMLVSKWKVLNQIGCGQKKEKHLRMPEVGHFRAQGVPMKRKLREFPVTEDALLPVGSTIGVRHFVPCQFVDVTGITKGKGFGGGMKRWGFKGMPASHGASLSHRSISSTGQRDTAGKEPLIADISDADPFTAAD